MIPLSSALFQQRTSSSEAHRMASFFFLPPNPARYDMTEANVKYHMAQAYKKLGVKDKAGAVLEAKNRQLI